MKWRRWKFLPWARRDRSIVWEPWQTSGPLWFSPPVRKVGTVTDCLVETIHTHLWKKNKQGVDSLVSCRGRLCQCPLEKVWGDPSSLVSPSAWWGSRPGLQSQTRWRKTDCWPLSRLCPSPRGRSVGNPVGMWQLSMLSPWSLVNMV